MFCLVFLAYFVSVVCSECNGLLFMSVVWAITDTFTEKQRVGVVIMYAYIRSVNQPPFIVVNTSRTK